MFPTISSLIQYFTGWQLPLPFHTFGTVMALAFAAAYWAYRSELKRKEAEGWLQPVQKTVYGTGWQHIVLYALVAGLITAKLIPALQHYRSFAAHPERMLFSGVGNWWGGVLAAAMVAGFMTIRKIKAGARTHHPVTVHPYQIMNGMLWWCGLTGFMGAILFHKLEHVEQFLQNPWQVNGFTYYGGLLCGIATALFIAHRHKIPLVHMLDMGSPAMILAYGIGRLGCHLSGDGDWGIVNTAPMPHGLSFLPSSCWAYHYPLNNEPVFPTSLYECIACLFLFVVLWQLRCRITTPGRLFALYCLLNGTERLLIEQIKINPAYAIGWLHITQAELIGGCFIGIGFFFLYYTRRLAVYCQLNTLTNQGR